jgi:hypothetical protein
LPPLDEIEFSTEGVDDIEFPRAPADRPGRYRVDRGAPEPPVWRRDRVEGPSDGRVVGRVGQGIGQVREPLAYAPPPRAPAQESRVVVVTNRSGQALPVRPSRPVRVPTALERLGSVDIGDDPFS